MAEKIVSPGVFTNEVDQSFLPSGIQAIGAAVIGPTAKGPAGIPTVVSSYSEFVQIFGSVFTSGSEAVEQTYKYLTNYSAQEYLKYADTLTVVRILAGTYSPATSTVSCSVTASNVLNSFTLTTLADGADQNSVSTEGTNNILPSGSVNNLRWEVTSVNNNKGTFTLLIRRGDDTIKRKIILEQYNNLTLDPNSSDFISKRIGDQVYTLRDSGGTDPFLQLSGSFENKSKYVRVSDVRSTLNYLDSNGNVRLNSASGSLPAAGSGSFSGGSNGTVSHPQNFFDTISDTNVQGYNPNTAISGGTAYSDAIKLLKNQDEYDINLITLPGLVDDKHGSTISELIQMCEDRGDCFAIIDPVLYASTITTATSKAEARDSNYAAMYWPWIKIPDAELGKNVWVPASVVLPGVYAFNDKVAAPWFAPAGLNRGGIDIAISTERKLTHANRDTLYDSNVNPIATFPNAGVTVFGQKTLQKKASALDRVNVRRLLIAAKKFIASTTKFLVFENNTSATRNRFLSIVNPYFESVQQRQGLYAFKVVMDETNNTPDIIDRNLMVGTIFLQPAKTAEFIQISFNIMPTGATFPE